MTAIDDKWRQIPWIGQPVDTGAGTEEMAMPDGRGRARDFEHGTICWTPETGAHEVHGDIRVKWAQHSFLGYPTTDETVCPDGVGRFNHFEHGSVYWTPETGAHEVHGMIRDKWQEQGWEAGRLRYPISDEKGMEGGRFSQFQGGSIKWTPSGGAVIGHNID